MDRVEEIRKEHNLLRKIFNGEHNKGCRICALLSVIDKQAKVVKAARIELAERRDILPTETIVNLRKALSDMEAKEGSAPTTVTIKREVWEEIVAKCLNHGHKNSIDCAWCAVRRVFVDGKPIKETSK